MSGGLRRRGRPPQSFGPHVCDGAHEAAAICPNAVRAGVVDHRAAARDIGNLLGDRYAGTAGRRWARIGERSPYPPALT